MATQGGQQKSKCTHGACSCLVDPGQSYCSDQCAQASKGNTAAELPGGKHSGAGCACGHPGCEGTRRT